jgi:ABC-2 type transport system ATP-binding protein
MSEPAVVARGLSKSFEVHERAAGLGATLRSLFHRKTRTVVAVDDVSFSVEPGERVGFLGPNGAGKTTTLKMLSGLLHPTAGEARVAGHVPKRREAEFLRQITLVMGQKQQLLWDLPPVETFALNRALYGLSAAEHAESMTELDELLELGDVAKKPTRQLSLGERMRCELAAALLHRPRVLFLDEPTIGLDVAMQLKVREFVRTYNERRGATVLLTSHYMDDVLALCPRVVIIDEGHLRYDGSLAALVERTRPDKRVVLKLAAPLPEGELTRLGTVVEASASRVVLDVRRDRTREVVSHLLAYSEVVDLTIEDPPLEEVMRELFAERPEAD